MEDNSLKDAILDLRVAAGKTAEQFAELSVLDAVAGHMVEAFAIAYQDAPAEHLPSSRRELKLDTIWALRKIADAIHDYQFGLVESAFIEGATWQEIGDALGVSRQAAHQKYGR
jgi:hypothetical protein